MASALLEALMGTQRSAASDPYGIIASGIGQAAPALVNPYASTGTNLGLTLGAGLLSGLLGGIAQKRADEENALSYQQGMQLFGITDPAKRAEMIQANPRLAGVGLAMQAAQSEQQAEIAKEERKAKLELENQKGAKLFEAAVGAGIVDPGTGAIKVDEAGNPLPLPDPTEEAVRKAGAIKRAELEAENQANPNMLGGIPKNLQNDAQKEVLALANQDKAIEFIDSQFEQAKNIKSTAAMIPGTTSANDIEGVAGSLRLFVQKYLGREMNATEQTNFLKLVPDWNDTKGQIEAKKARFKDMMGAFTQATPILDSVGQVAAQPQAVPGPVPQGGNTVVGPDGQTYVFTD